MKKPFFTESDCDIPGIYNVKTGEVAISLAKANRLFDEWLAKGKVVWCSLDVIRGTPLAEVWYGDNPRSHTHTAILVNIEPIDQPDTAEKLLADLVGSQSEFGGAQKLWAIIERARALLTKPKGG